MACTTAPPLPSPGPSVVATPAPTAIATLVPTATAAPSTTPTPGPTLTAIPTPTLPPTSAPTMPAATVIAAELAKSGSLTVCLALMGAPAASLNDQGDPDGYNVAFAREIAARLGLEPVIQQTLFDDLISDIKSHACDVSVSSQNITTSRIGQMNLIPYTRSQQPVVVAKGNPAAVQSLDDLCGLSVSATTGTTHVDLVNGTGDYLGQGLNEQCAAHGREPIDLHTYDTELDAVQALLDGAVVAYLGNPNFVFDYPDYIEYAPTTLPPARQGIATAIDHPALTSAVQAAFNAMVDDGKYLAILRNYLPNEASVKVVSIIE